MPSIVVVRMRVNSWRVRVVRVGHVQWSLVEGDPMKKTLAITTATILATLTLTSSPAAATCNWGELTSTQIAEGFDQGGHAADPSGDGHGPGTVDEPRIGLANIVELGNLTATCHLIAGL